MNYWLIFLTGLTTGGLSCLAVQGGLLAATLANTAEKKDITHNALPTVIFLVTKLMAYTILGAFLGYFGSVFKLTRAVQIIFQAAAAIIMLGLAGNMLNLHPVFRYFVIQPPRWVGKLLRSQTKSHSFFAPALLGTFTIFIPCPVTQAMEILAISSANPMVGSLIMASFILGTGPLFLAVGWITTKLSETFRERFFKVAAVLVIFIALTSLNGALVLAGSKYSLNNWVWAFKSTFLAQANRPSGQEITINVSSRGYSPANFSVKAGRVVTLDLITQNSRSCANDFNIPGLGVRKILPPTGITQVVFTPSKRGPLAFTCGMGMFTGPIDVQ